MTTQEPPWDASPEQAAKAVSGHPQSCRCHQCMRDRFPTNEFGTAAKVDSSAPETKDSQDAQEAKDPSLMPITSQQETGDASRPAFADYGFAMHPDWSNAGGIGSSTVSRPASPAPKGDSEPTEAKTAQANTTAAEIDTGDVAPSVQDQPEAGDPGPPTRAVDVLAISKRFMAEGRWKGQIEFERNDMMKLAKPRFKEKSERQQWVYGELDRLYPPQLFPLNAQIAQSRPYSSSEDGEATPKVPNVQIAQSEGSIQGLGTIPEGWPDLPANASLAAELGWVQANRLRIVAEKPGKATVVDLGRALSPAPSWAALGWLETSIRSYAKFVDAVGKATGGDEGETGVMRRERVSIEDCKALMRDMVGADLCPTCGRPL